MNKATRQWMVLAICVSVACGMGWARQNEKNRGGGQTRLFQGTWFSVRYPADFTVVPSLKHVETNDYQSAFFVSPDKSVKFYVFASIWKMNLADVRFNPATERRIYRKLEKTTRKGGTTTILWTTVRAKDGSYIRALQERTSSGDMGNVFGIIYRRMADYERYKAQYLRFKESYRDQSE